MSSEQTKQSTATPESISCTPSYLNEHEKQVYDDYDWCIHDPEIRRQYGDQVVAVHQRRIWGVGANHLAALNSALQQPGCPPRYFLALAVIPPLVPGESDSSPPGT